MILEYQFLKEEKNEAESHSIGSYLQPILCGASMGKFFDIRT